MKTKLLFCALVVILLLSGCTVDPATLALIPTPVPEPPTQPCEPEREKVFLMLHEGSDADIEVYCGDQLKDDSWLLSWAKDAIARDDASKMMKGWEAGTRTDGATFFYMYFFLEADRSCLENRGELAGLIETYAEKFRDRAHIDFPLLAAVSILRSDVLETGEGNWATSQDESSTADKIDCSSKFSALSVIPDPLPFCLTGVEDEVGPCFNVAPGSTSTSSQCNAAEAMISPGQTVAAEISDELAAHIDITAISSALSGETLTAVFHLKDVPESLTFDRAGVEEGEVEYLWEVSIDLDNDLETGFGGFEYTLSALYFVRPLSVGANTTEPIGDKMPADIWAVAAEGGIRTIKDASIEVSVDADTITLTGDIPGITADSRLAFKALDHQSGTDRVGCFNWPSSAPRPAGCDSDEAMVRPGQTVAVDASDALEAYMDIIEVSSALSGETLAAVFQLRDVPASLTFNRTGVGAGYVEYKWKVSIDTDNDRDTGFAGIDYALTASHSVPRSGGGSDVVDSIASQVQAFTWQSEEDILLRLDDAGFEISTQAGTITLVGDIPGITSESRLTFETYDFFNGSDEVVCRDLSTGG